MDIPQMYRKLTPPRHVNQVLEQAYAVAKHLGLKTRDRLESKFEGRTDHYVDLRRGIFSKRTTVELQVYYGEDGIVETLWSTPNLGHSYARNQEAMQDFSDFNSQWNNFCMDKDCEKRQERERIKLAASTQ